MTTGKLAEQIRDDIEAQAVASSEALRYWQGRGLPQSESYWEGWRDRGGAIAQAIRLQISIDDFDEYTQDLIKERDKTIANLRQELKDVQSKNKKLKADVSAERKEAKYQYIKRLIACGARIVVTTHDNATWYYTNDDGKKVNIPHAIMDMLKKDNIQYDLWSSKLKAA